MTLRVVVLGASGFVGSAVFEVLRSQGHSVVALRAPRILPVDEARARDALDEHAGAVDDLIAQFRGADTVVNAAGNPDASNADVAALIAANGVLPGVVGRAVRRAEVPRYVHVSSAVVQGRRPQLDQSSELDPFSAYSRTKAVGEQLALEEAPQQSVIYRPPSVHAIDRRVTQMIGRIARSPLATVAKPGSSPSPQALITNVASAVAYLATTDHHPLPIVAHPSEGITTAGLMAELGGKPPREIPCALAKVVVAALNAGGKANTRLAADARRIELLWFGQGQASSWLTEAGWTPPEGRSAWQDLGRQLAAARTYHA